MQDSRQTDTPELKSSLVTCERKGCVGCSNSNTTNTTNTKTPTHQHLEKDQDQHNMNNNTLCVTPSKQKQFVGQQRIRLSSPLSLPFSCGVVEPRPLRPRYFLLLSALRSPFSSRIVAQVFKSDLDDRFLSFVVCILLRYGHPGARINECIHQGLIRLLTLLVALIPFAGPTWRYCAHYICFFWFLLEGVNSICGRSDFGVCGRRIVHHGCLKNYWHCLWYDMMGLWWWWCLFELLLFQLTLWMFYLRAI